MKKLLIASALFFTSALAFALPSVQITAPVQTLKNGQSTTLTFKFTEAPSGFDSSDIHIRGDALLTTTLTGSGTTYTIGITKSTNDETLSVIVDNRSFTATATGEQGIGNFIGFNTVPEIYIKEGGDYNGKLILANPQPTAIPMGYVLVNKATGLPSTPVLEQFFVKQFLDNKKAYTIKEISRGNLFRLLSTQEFRPKTNPKDYELRNVHGGHNNMQMMPKITNVETTNVQGRNKRRVRIAAYGALCTPASPDAASCGFSGDFRTHGYATAVTNDDPIVYPGLKGAAHMHCFTGNTSVNYQSTDASLNRASSTFSGGTLNRNGVWTPCIVDTSTGTAMIWDLTSFYYKVGVSAYNEFTEPLRKGQRIIWGNPAGKPGDAPLDFFNFECVPSDANAGTIPNIKAGYIPECSGSKYVKVIFTLASTVCFKDDGAGKMMLDSPDHRSHAQPYGYSGAIGTNGCGTLYPHRTNHVEIKFEKKIAKNQNTKNWRLSSDNYSTAEPGGYSAHFDYWVFWNPDMIARITEQCNKTPIDCHVNEIGLSDGIGIASITTSGNIGTITTIEPHKVSTAYTRPARISGVTGTSAASYNMNLAPYKLNWYTPNPNRILPVGSQLLTPINPTQFTYTLNSTPSSTVIDVTNAKVQFNEILCDNLENDEECPQDYSDLSLRNYAE